MDLIRSFFELSAGPALVVPVMLQGRFTDALGIYLALAVLSLASVVLSLLLGDLLDSLDVLDFAGEGAFPALAAGLFVFAVGGAVAIVLGASVLASVLWGLLFGLVAFLIVLRSLRWIATNQTTTALSAERVLGAEGRWKLSVSEEHGVRRGLVEVYIGSSREELRAETTATLREGDRIRVVRARSARDVEVEPL
jgi:hypothetical protein